MTQEQLRKIADEKAKRESAYREKVFLTDTSRTVTVHNDKLTDNKGNTLYSPTKKSAGDFFDK